MKTRDGNQFVEMPFSVMGKQFLEGLRKNQPELFGHQRIKDVIQAHPSKIKIGMIHQYT
jgi:hypothetical protein